jgi:hypothetical protein
MRLVWHFGSELPPPYFLSFGIAFVISGAFFAIAFGALTGLLFYFASPVPVWLWLTAAGVAGLLFGLIMSAFWSFQRRRLGLPSWGEYPAPPAA